MKTLNSISMVVLLVFSSTVNAQLKVEPENDFEKLLIGRFEQIAGGFYVNELCDFISGDEKQELIQKITRLNVFAQRKFGSQVILHSQRMGRLGASRKPYSECGDTSKEFFEASRLLINDLYVHVDAAA